MHFRYQYDLLTSFIVSTYECLTPSIIICTQAYLSDDFPHKVNVGVGAYRCEQGKPFVLPVVREAENELIAEELDHEYSGIVSACCVMKYTVQCHLQIGRGFFLTLESSVYMLNMVLSGWMSQLC